MSKKKKKKDEAEPAAPKFAGWKQLDALKGFKQKLADEAEAAKKRSDDASGNKSGKAAPAPRPRRDLPKPSADAAEDELTFHRMMSGVVPLGEKAARVPVTSEAKAKPRAKPEDLREKAKREAEDVLAHLAQLVDDPVRFEVTDDGKHVEGRRADVPPALLRSLRHGTLPIDGRLDLHGLSVGEAREAVFAFLRDQRARGERVVLVIHGKGEGVLRGEMAAWLSQGRSRDHVAAFATAVDRDGGEGAVYVALRR